MKPFKPLLTVLASSALIMSSFPSHAFFSFGSDKQEIKIAHYMAESHPHHVALLEFERNVEERTNGELKISIFPNGMLGSEKQMINGIRNGTIQAALFGSLMQDLDFKLGFVEMPFLFKDYDHVQRFFESDVSKEIEQTFETYNVKHLANVVLGFRIMTSNKPINSPNDYTGVRLRVPNTNIFVSMAKNLGVNGQAMAFTEVFTALEQGVVDAQEGPLSTIKSQAYHEIQDYAIITNHMFTALNLGMNKDFYDKLSPEFKAIVDEEANNFGQLASKLTIEENNSILAFFEQNGMEVIEPNEEFYRWNVTAVEPIYEDIYQKHAWSAEYVEKIRNL